MSIRSISLMVVMLASQVRPMSSWGRAEQMTGYTLTPLVQTGDQLPAQVTFAQFGPLAMNDAGQLAFIAGDQSGLYLLSDETVEPIALTSQGIPGLDGVFFTQITALALNSQGDIAFAASMLGSREGEGIFIYSRTTGMMRPIIFSGDRVPGPLFASFQSFPSIFLNDNGDVAFTGRFRDVDAGAFLFSNGTTLPIAVPNQEAPGTGGAQFRSAAARSLTNSGALLIQASIRGGSASGGIFFYQGGTLKPIVLTGQGAPGTGGGMFIRFDNARLITENGDLVFEGMVQGGSVTGGLFTAIAGVIEPVAFGGKPLAVAGGKSVFSFTPAASNLKGEFAFRAEFSGQEQGLFLYSQRTLSLVVLSDQTISGSFARRLIPTGDVALNAQKTIAFVGETASPTTTGVYVVTGGTFTAAVTSHSLLPEERRLRLSSDAALTDDGAVAFTSVLTGNGLGLYLTQGGAITPVVTPGQTVPGGTGTLIRELGEPAFNRYAITDQGQIGLIATLTGASANAGVFRAAAATLEPVALSGQSAQGLPQTSFGDFSQVVVNNAGAVAFSCFLTQQGKDKEAIVVFANKKNTIIAAQGDAAPGTSNARFESFMWKGLWINDKGEIAFIAELNNGLQGVFLYSSGKLKKVALSGEEPPETSGEAFESFGSVMINNRAEIVFDSTFSSGEGGVFVFASEKMKRVALSGTEAPGTNGRTFAAFSRTAINEAGEVAFFARWGSVGRGIFFASAGTVTPVVLSGQLIPGPVERRFFEFYGLSLNSKGEIVFAAALDSSPLPSAVFLAKPVPPTD